MRIALDISPIDDNSTSAHKVRGVGKYITLLKDNIQNYDKKNTYIFTSSPSSVAADIVHYPYFDPFFVTLPFNFKIKTVVTVHDLIPIVHSKEFPSGLKGKIKWNVNKILLKKADAILTDSMASKQDIHSITNIQNTKIFPVYLSADPIFKKENSNDANREKLMEKFSLPNEFILYVGDVTWNKNLPRLVNAVKKSGIPLVMVGKALTETNIDLENPWNHDRRQVIAQIENDKLFVRLGFVSNEDLASLYTCAEALIMPSIDEGFGLPVLEAMKSGCPTIISKLGSLPEVGGDASLYVDPYSVDDISYAIEKITKDNNLRNSLKDKGYLQAEKFTLDAMMKNTVSVYETVYQQN